MIDFTAAENHLRRILSFIRFRLKMWIKLIFMLLILSQMFMRSLICNLVTPGFYYTETSQVSSNMPDRENVLSEAFFHCGMAAECSHVAKSTRTGDKVIKSRAELESIKADETLWIKSIGKEPGE